MRRNHIVLKSNLIFEIGLMTRCIFLFLRWRKKDWIVTRSTMTSLKWWRQCNEAHSRCSIKFRQWITRKAYRLQRASCSVSDPCVCCSCCAFCQEYLLLPSCSSSKSPLFSAPPQIPSFPSRKLCPYGVPSSNTLCLPFPDT